MRVRIRVWQTALFVFVVLVALGILLFSVFDAVSQGARDAAKYSLIEHVSDLAEDVSDDLPAGTDLDSITEHTEDFVRIFHDDAWVYDADGALVISRVTHSVPGEVLSAAIEKARRRQVFTRIDLTRRLAIAAAPVEREGKLIGVVVAANNGENSWQIIQAARSRMVAGFIIALLVSGAVALGFSEFIAYQVRTLTKGALAIAEGDFGQRLRGFFPDEVGELAEAFNLMAGKLGQAFDTLSAQQQEIVAVINTMGEGLIGVDGDGTIRLANPAASELLKRPLDQLAGESFESVIKSEALVESISEAMIGHEVFETTPHEGRDVLFHATPIRDELGRIGGVVLILRDVTQARRLEQAQRDFIANASHELRTPLTSLKGYLELLEDGAKEKTEVRDRFLGTMQREVGRMERLVRDLFTLAHIDAGQIQLKLGGYAPADLVDDVWAVGKPVADIAGLRLEKTLAPGLEDVMADRDRIVQVMVGFVDNAIKNGRPGDAVTVFADRRNGRVVMGVRDTGEGIPEEVLPRVFDRFFRRTRVGADSKGAGLGLAIAKEIVEAHGGTIQVDSKPGQGTTFSFDLPKAPVA